jgi:hypothetical protein
MPALEITTMIGCPLMCTYCPQDRLKAAYQISASPASGSHTPGRETKTKYLNLADFETVLSKVPGHVRIDFSGMAEPWANPDATRMLERALRAGRSVAIYTTLSGIGREDCEQVLDLLQSHLNQLEILCLHLPDANGSMRGWKYSTEYEETLNKFLEFGRRELSGQVLRESLKSATPRFQVMTMDGSGRIHEDLAHLGIELPAWQGHTRAGTLNAEPEKTPSLRLAPRHDAAVSCSWTPFYDRNVLLPNGDVVLCCMDYSLKHIIGNLLTGDYESLFRSEEMLRIRQVNSQPGFSKCTLCKSCDDAQVYILDKTSWIERPDSGFEIWGLASDGWLTRDAEIRVYVAQSGTLQLKLEVPDWLPAKYPFEIRARRGNEIVHAFLVQAPGHVEINCPMNATGTIRLEGGQWFKPSDLFGNADDRLICFKLDEQSIVPD